MSHTSNIIDISIYNYFKICQSKMVFLKKQWMRSVLQIELVSHQHC